MRNANAVAYYLQRLKGVVFFHWRALSWSRNWEAHLGHSGSAQQRQRSMASMLVRGPVTHQSATSRSFRQGTITPHRTPVSSRNTSPTPRR